MLCVRWLQIFVIILGVTLVSFAQQGTIDKNGIYHPSEEQIAKYKRLGELLRHPTFITLRLASMRRDVPTEAPSTTPSPYTNEQWFHFESFITQNSGEDLEIMASRNPYYAYRPELILDGEVVPYTKRAQERLENAQRGLDGFSQAPRSLKSGREYQSNYVELEDWYEIPLKLGRYQLTIKERFTLDGDWVESNPVTFDVVPRKTPNAIPDGFKVKVVIERPKPQEQGKLYQLAYNDGLATELVNESGQQVYVSVIDKYYGHHLRLTKDGKVIPYSDEVVTLIESKEKDSHLIEIVNGFFLDPKTVQRLDGFSLKQWYGPLAPGIYHLTDRRRFEIEGPWTKDSAELVFELVP